MLKNERIVDMEKKEFKDMTFNDFLAIDVEPYCEEREAKDDQGKKH